MAGDPARNYRNADLVALATFGRNTCYWPGCAEPILRIVNGKYVMNTQVSHIRGAERNGPRYDDSMTDDQRRSFANLVYLCHPHHVTVDKINPSAYPVEVLEGWKAAAEQDHRGTLAEIRGLTEDTLERMVAAALDERINRIEAALNQFQAIDPEAVRLLRDALGDLNALRLPTRGTAQLLAEAAWRLRNINRSATLLNEAAIKLRMLDLRTTANQLHEAAAAIRSARRR